MTHALRARLGAVALAVVASSSALLATPTAAFAYTSAAAPAAAAADPGAYTLDTTVAVGSITRDLAVDDASGRVYVPVDRDDDPGQVTWLDASTDTASADAFTLGEAAPENLQLSPDGSRLYVMHYGNGILSVVDTASGDTIREIGGLPEYPGGLVQDTDTGMLYVLDDGLVPVDPATGTVGDQVAISTQAYPLLKDAVYDSANRMIWVAEGRSGVITGFNTVSGRWIDSLAIPITSFMVDGAALGGRPALLAIDEQLGQLYVAVQPRLTDDWTDYRIVTIDTSTTKLLGSPIEVGDTTRKLAVNPATHEVYALNGFSNTLSVISPDTWTVSHTLDFTELGVTQGTGTQAADVWALGVSGDGTTLYVTHPYGESRMSVISRIGAAPAVTEPAVAPGQDETTEPETPVNDVWDGPAAATSAPAPDEAVAVQAPSLRWSFSEYAKAWTTEPLGAVALDGDEFVFSGGSGWTDPVTGATSIAWGEGFRIRHYAFLAPDVITTLGNPVLTVDAAGAGTLSFDVSWSVSADTASDGYARVVVATFSGATVTRTGDAVSISATPDYEGRPYDTGATVSPSSWPAEWIEWFDPSMRPWWYSTGASMDPLKAPNPFTVSFTAAVSAVDDPDEGTPAPVAGSGLDGDAVVQPAAADVAAGSALASTGAEPVPALALGAAVVAAGAALLLLLRRLRRGARA